MMLRKAKDTQQIVSNNSTSYTVTNYKIS